VAAYGPLGVLPFAEDIASYARAQASPDLRALAQAQIVEPAREVALLSEAGISAPDGDTVCSRWVDAALVQPVALSAMLTLRFPALRGSGLDSLAKPRVLVHGCGPGKDAIAWARNVGDAVVVGVEANSAELALALRKAEELDLPNASFVAADPGRDFDMVACPALAGEMDSLTTALGRLSDRTISGGWLHIGVRAEASRAHIAAAREFAREGGYAASAAGARACRRAFLDLPDDVAWKAIGAHFGLHTRAGCHELFFGAERPYATIATLAGALDANSLEFWGFENEQATAAYRQAFPADQHGRNLDAWAAWEQATPALFMPTYTFWARKPE
jgi:SAM-dependent methyltransferase